MLLRRTFQRGVWVFPGYDRQHDSVIPLWGLKATKTQGSNGLSSQAACTVPITASPQFLGRPAAASHLANRNPLGRAALCCADKAQAVPVAAAGDMQAVLSAEPGAEPNARPPFAPSTPPSPAAPLPSLPLALSRLPQLHQDATGISWPSSTQGPPVLRDTIIALLLLPELGIRKLNFNVTLHIVTSKVL